MHMKLTNHVKWMKILVLESLFSKDCPTLPWTVSVFNWFTLSISSTVSHDIQYNHVSVLCAVNTGIVLGTIFAGGTLISSNEMSPGELMSFLVASQTVQR